jgi:hypothetical protein
MGSLFSENTRLDVLHHSTLFWGMAWTLKLGMTLKLLGERS